MGAASWALAARDAAIEKGAAEHATRFAQQAREAIEAAAAAGVTCEQLAYELDYPGGAAELDGTHVDIGIASGAPLTAAELAGWDTAWDEAMTAASPAHPDDIWGAGDTDGDADGDGGGSREGDRAHGGAGVGDAPAAVAWWEPVDPEFTLTRDEVVAELTHRGMTADQATAAVTRYLDETSQEIGVPVHRWGMDSHDIDAITHTHTAAVTGRPMSDPWASAAGPDLTSAAQTGPDREDAGPARDGRGHDLPALPDLAPDLPTASAPGSVEPTVQEIADLTARLRALTRRDPGADPVQDAAERAAFLADKDALLARITATDHTEASTAHTLGDAEETTPHHDTTGHRGLDRSDLGVIAAEQRVAAVRDAVTQTGTEPARSSRQDGGAAEQERRAQLAAWAHADATDDHTSDDHTTDDTDTDSAGHGMELQR